MTTAEKKRVVLCITGASGTIYALRTAEMLAKAECEVCAVVSDCAKTVAQTESETDIEAQLRRAKIENVYAENDFFAPPASGSAKFDAVAIVPCSMKTIGKIANSIADNLIVRAAEVALKERRRLVVVPREAPYATAHLRNMLTLSEAGAVVLPASPAFYFKPATITDLADFVAARILSAIGIEQEFLKEWGK